MSQEPDHQTEWAAELRQHLQFMEQAGIGKLLNGYCFGESISFVDLTYYP
ncbi:MAG: hypothetical protein AAFY26_15220 [Cyanobacteria bacterium J06638_22]